MRKGPTETRQFARFAPAAVYSLHSFPWEAQAPVPVTLGLRVLGPILIRLYAVIWGSQESESWLGEEYVLLIVIGIGLDSLPAVPV